MRTSDAEQELAAAGQQIERLQHALLLAQQEFHQFALRVSHDFATDLDCCRLHLAVRMLGWSDDWQPPPDHARNWLVEADEVPPKVSPYR